ncbi:MAG: macro domain-containing protein [Gammaproteobacteria bacterium]|nr:macro domain-containing protein [Gammaproteobacteria bacterium]
MKSSFNLHKGSCIDVNADVVVNAANNYLLAGGGICGVIFFKAGMDELTEACAKYKTPLNDGVAVITPSYNLKRFKAIIHAVGPNFNFNHHADDKLFDAYYNSLLVLKKNNYHSISFPLISAGIFGGPIVDIAAVSTHLCYKAYLKFIETFKDYPIEVYINAFTDEEFKLAKKVFDYFNLSI